MSLTLDRYYKADLTLRTPRITLRKPSMDDAEAMFAYCQDPEYFRFLPAEVHDSIDATRTFLKSVTDGIAQENGKLYWAVVPDVLQRPIGMINLHGVEPDHQCAEIGYAIDRAQWGNGYVSEAVRAVLDCAFQVLGFHRIAAICDIDNISSERVMQKCGMHFEGTLRGYRVKRGERRSFRLYARLNSN